MPVVATVAPRGEGVAELEAEPCCASRPATAWADSRHAAAAGGRAARRGGRAAHRRARPTSGLARRPAALGARAAAASPCSRATPRHARRRPRPSTGPHRQPTTGLALEIAQGAARRGARPLAAAVRSTRAAADRWWRLTTSPRTGIPILLGVIAAMFATLFVVGDLLSRVLTAAWTAWISPAVDRAASRRLRRRHLGKIVLWGVDGGILATLAVGIPYILTFYFILALDRGHRLHERRGLPERPRHAPLRAARAGGDPADRRRRLQRAGDHRDALARQQARADHRRACWSRSRRAAPARR